MKTATFLVNPFNFYSQAIIPAGTVYTNENPKDVDPMVVKRRITNRVEMTTRGFAQFMGDDIWIDYPTIEVCATSGWFKKIVLTEELIIANGFTPEYETIPVKAQYIP